MAKFVYRMQSILDIKYKLEEQERTAYGIASQRLQEENTKLQQLMLRRMEYEKHAAELAIGLIDVRAIQENKRAIDVMKSLIRDQIMKVHAAEKNLELVREAHLKQIEDHMSEIVELAAGCSLTEEEAVRMLRLMWEMKGSDAE